MDTLLATWLQTPQTRGLKVAVRYKKGDRWETITWVDYYKLAEMVGASLIASNIVPGDRVAIMANSRPEWAYADLGIMGIGAVTVPIYQSSLTEEIEYILNNCQASVLICENRYILSRWQQVSPNCPSVKLVICMDDFESRPQQILSWSEFLSRGRIQLGHAPTCYKDRARAVKSADSASIIYTSGTTGQPKGVLLCHEQIMSEVSELFGTLPVSAEDSTLSFLPYAHVMGRVESWGHVYQGFEMAFAESIDLLRQNISEIKPTVLIGVPRIFEKIYTAVLNQAGTNFIRRNVFQWALSVGQRVSRCRVQREPIPAPLLAEYLAAKKLVFSPLMEKLGGRMRFAISGGAPLSPEIGEFFHAAGLLILEGYGLTETTAAVCINTPFDYQFGSVGKPIGDVQVKLADDGEILIKSAKVMKEYYRDPEATAAVMRDGYFATGDIGEFTKTGHLKITDRKKDLIKTAGGKYVAPQKLENLLKNNQYISQVLVHGDKKKYIVALVTLDHNSLKAFAEANHIAHKNEKELSEHPKVKELVRGLIAEVNSQLASFETIKNFAILPQEFSIETGELTPSLKIKRKFCDGKYAALLDSLY